MPQVPVYDGPQVREQAQTGGFLDANQFTGGARTLQDVGKSLLDVGAAADRIAQRDAQRAAYDAQSAIQSKFLEYQQQYQKDRVGDRAKGLTGDVDKWWATAATTTGKEMDPMSRQLVSQALTQARLQALAGAGQFENQQLEIATNKSWLAAKLTAKSNGVVNALVPVGTDADGHPILGVDSARADLRKKNAEYAVRMGLDATVLGALNLADTTELHTQVLQGLARNAPADARAYFEKFKGEINGEKWAEISKQIDTVGNLAKAQEIGAKLAQEYDYTQTTRAVKVIIDGPGSPEYKAAARAELEHWHAIQQSDADKGQALAVSKVMEMLYSGTSPANILKSPQYGDLRDKGQVLKAIQDKGYSDILRAQATDARAIAALTRHETELHLKSAAEAFNWLNPEKLSSAPRATIEALLPTLGRQWTAEILQRKDTMEKKGVADAKVDHDDMMAIMVEMGQKPFDKVQTPEGKAAIVTTQSRIERMLTQLQQASGKPLSREQKNQIMREEVAKSVTVDNRFWFNDTKPAVELTPEELNRVIVPPQEVTLIYDEMKDLYKRSAGKMTEYEPTPENMRRYYLTSRKGSMTANMIPAAPK